MSDALILYRDTEKVWHGVYVSNDGEIESLGYTLQTFHESEEKAETITGMGTFSYINTFLDPAPDGKTDARKYSMNYVRDKGYTYDDLLPKTDTSLQEVVKSLTSANCGYIWIAGHKNWYYTDNVEGLHDDQILVVKCATQTIGL